jgi:hypothetical protein
MSANIEQLFDAVSRAPARPRRRAARQSWSKADITRLRGLVGKMMYADMAKALGRSVNAVKSKLQMLGYRLTADVSQAVGVSAIELSRRTGIPHEVVWKDIKRGRIKRVTRIGTKDYLIPHRNANAYARAVLDRLAKRERAIARIKRPTMTKSEFMRKSGLSETHCTRYLQHGIVRGWKVPCKWVSTKRYRWEWLVDREDGERVIKARDEGTLSLRKRSYRAASARAGKQVTQLRRERRLGLRPARSPKQSRREGYLSVAEVAMAVGLSEVSVRSHVDAGRLACERRHVGRRARIDVPESAMADYRAWLALPLASRGRARPCVYQRAQAHELGLTPIADAARGAGVSRFVLLTAIEAGIVPAQRVGRLICVRQADAEAFAASRRNS